VDGDVQDFEEGADSFDLDDWQLLDRDPVEGRQAHTWVWRDVSEGAQQFLRRH
jgi:hypothetical protein